MKTSNHRRLSGFVLIMCVALTLTACPKQDGGDDAKPAEKKAEPAVSIVPDCDKTAKNPIYKKAAELTQEIIEKLKLGDKFKDKKIKIVLEEVVPGKKNPPLLGSTTVDESDPNTVTITISAFLQVSYDMTAKGGDAAKKIADQILLYVLAHELEHACADLPADSLTRKFNKAYDAVGKKIEELETAVKEGKKTEKETRKEMKKLLIEMKRVELENEEHELAEEKRIQKKSREEHKSTFGLPDNIVEYLQGLEAKVNAAREAKIKKLKKELKDLGVDIDKEREEDAKKKTEEEKKADDDKSSFYPEDSGSFFGNGLCGLGTVDLDVVDGSVLLYGETGEPVTLELTEAGENAASGVAYVFDLPHDCQISRTSVMVESELISHECVSVTGVQDCDEKNEELDTSNIESENLDGIMVPIHDDITVDDLTGDEPGIYCSAETEQVLMGFTLSCQHSSGASCNEVFSL